MKLKRRNILAIIALAMIMAMLLPDCAPFFNTVQQAEAAAKMSSKYLVLRAGKTKTIKVKGGGDGYTWTSTDSGVAKVTRKAKKTGTAVVTAVKEGVAVVTATKGKVKYQCKIVVLDKYDTEPKVQDSTKAFSSITVYETKGTININRDSKTIKAAKNMKLINDDYSIVGKKGLIRLSLADEMYAYFEEGSEYAITKGWFNRIKVGLTVGEMIIEARKKLSADDSFDVMTPNTNMAIRGTVAAVRTEILKDGSIKTINYVLEGSATLTFPGTKKKAVTLKAGEGWETVKGVDGKITESKKANASGLKFKGIKVKNLKGADGAKLIINTDSIDENDNNDSGADNSNTNQEGSLDHVISQAKWGEIITFGSYEQDNNRSNGKEPIQWKILSRDGSRALLLSVYALDCQAYDSNGRRGIDLKTSSVSEWLDSDFYKNAFSKDEQSMILKDASIDQYVFLMKSSEMTQRKYGFSAIENSYDENRRTIPTEYARAEFSWNVGVGEDCPCWLVPDDCEVAILSDGKVDKQVDLTDDTAGKMGIQPAIYISYKDDGTGAEFAVPKPEYIWETIEFGSYEQDNNLNNGKEPIEWYILSKTDTEMFVMSKYVLDCKQYNEENTEVTWETCTLRKWLNEDFYKEAFDSTEQSKIKTSNVKNSNNSDYDISGGNDTRDKVFLLSIEDILNTDYGFSGSKYGSDINITCAPTAYAKTQGVTPLGNNTTIDGEESCRWWLRSPGRYAYYAANVTGRGTPDSGGYQVDRSSFGVRPVMIINLE